MARTISQLDAAQEPLLGTDLVAISRDGNLLLRTTLARLPISDAVQDAIENIAVLTPEQKLAGATAAVGITPDGLALDSIGNPISPITDVELVTTDRILNQTDNGKILEASTNGIVFTVPAGLQKFQVILTPADGGSITIASGGGVLLNGATTSLTRSSANTGVQIYPRPVADSYKVTGI